MPTSPNARRRRSTLGSSPQPRWSLRQVQLHRAQNGAFGLGKWGFLQGDCAVLSVGTSGPAFDAGLAAGSWILKVNDALVARTEDVSAHLESLASCALTVAVQEGGDLPDTAAPLVVEAIVNRGPDRKHGYRVNGLQVTEVTDGGPGGTAGLIPGSTIVGVNDEEVDTGLQLQAALRNAGAGYIVRFRMPSGTRLDARRKSSGLSSADSLPRPPAELVAQLLQPPPPAVAKWIDGQQGESGGSDWRAAYRSAAVAAMPWLKHALTCVHVCSASKTTVKQLLGVRALCTNLNALGLFHELKEFCSATALRAGGSLAQYYIRARLREHVGGVDLPLHPAFVGVAVVRQDLPGCAPRLLGEAVLDDREESLYIHQLRLLAVALDGGFQRAVREATEPLGVKQHVAAIKGDARIRNKAQSAEDHRYADRPRPALNIDVNRCCLCCETPQVLADAAAALSERFGGVARVKNMYAWPDEKSEAQYHYRALMLSVLYDPGMSCQDLAAQPKVRALWHEHCSGPPQNPTEPWWRWREHALAAADTLRNAAAPARLVCEVQLVLRPYLEARRVMHLLYKVCRATCDSHLHRDFQAEGRQHEPTYEADFASRLRTKSSFLAAKDGDADVLRVRAESGGLDLAAVTTRKGAALLFLASEQGRAECVQLLIEHGADVHHTDNEGSSALHGAAVYGHTECARLLVVANADPMAGNDRGMTPLCASVLKGHSDVLSVLVPHAGERVDDVGCTGRRALFDAVLTGDVRCVKVLLRAKHVKADRPCDASSGYSQSPLGAAAEGGLKEIVTLLLDAGADPARRCGGVDTPLRLAASGSFSSCVAEIEKAFVFRCTVPGCTRGPKGTPHVARDANSWRLHRNNFHKVRDGAAPPIKT